MKPYKEMSSADKVSAMEVILVMRYKRPGSVNNLRRKYSIPFITNAIMNEDRVSESVIIDLVRDGEYLRALYQLTLRDKISFGMGKVISEELDTVLNFRGLMPDLYNDDSEYDSIENKLVAIIEMDTYEINERPVKVKEIRIVSPTQRISDIFRSQYEDIAVISDGLEMPRKDYNKLVDSIIYNDWLAALELLSFKNLLRLSSRDILNLEMYTLTGGTCIPDFEKALRIRHWVIDNIERDDLESQTLIYE